VCATKTKELETLREQNKQLEARNAVLKRLAKAVLTWDDHYSHKGLDHTSKEAVALRLEMHNAAVELRALSPKMGT
jgi:hypothetical protein